MMLREGGAAAIFPRMSPAEDLIRHLNVVLKNELTGINQYFLHARILKHQGIMKLADHEYKESIDEMRHADRLIDRILFLGGLPNVQEAGKPAIGKTAEEILRNDLALERKASADLREAATAADSEKDYVTADILHAIAASEDDHILFLQAQIKLIETMGLPSYLQTQV